MFQRVLLATDFSENSQAAYRWAAELAKGSRGTVLVMHVLEEDLVASAPLLAGYLHAEALEMGRYREEFRRGARQALHAAAEEVAALGVAVEEHLIEGGRPWQALVRAAQELSCGVIVLATHGRSGLTHMLIGSTAEKVVRAAPCPVLTVHRGDAPAKP